MTDLNSLAPANSGWELMYATDINNRGQIVGYGVRDGQFQEVCYEEGRTTYCYRFPIYSAFLLSPILEATIDIKPGWDPNTVNPRNRGRIPVAILSTKDFDASSQVDQNSLTFGSTGNEESLVSCNRRPRDVDGDGLKDVMCYFRIRSTGFQCVDTEGILKGKYSRWHAHRRKGFGKDPTMSIDQLMICSIEVWPKFPDFNPAHP